MNILVTGGAGFIGSNLVDRLIELRHSVIVLDDLSTGKIENINSKARFDRWCVADDLPDYTNIDIIYHLAALPRIQPSFAIPEKTILINSQGTINVLQLAKRCKAKLIYAGSSSFYFDPYANPYAYSKWIGEEHCKLYNKIYGVSTAIARFFNVYGPRHLKEGDYSTVIGIFEGQKLRNEPLTVTGTGEQRRDFTHVNDIVSGLIAIADRSWNADIFNLGSGINYSINEVAAMFQQEIKYLPARPGEAINTLADISDTVIELNWSPNNNLKTYVEAFLAEHTS